jgi:predicted RNA binding protein YcfA (HicA-like mRNA interferase family)
MTPAGMPVLSAHELIRILERAGFVLLRKSKGSHWQFQHIDGRRVTIPVHKGQDIGPGLMRKILRDAEMTVRDLKRLH